MPDIRKHQPPSRPHSIAAGTKPGAVQQWAVWAEEVERLLEQGKSKPAVELAKVAHKHTASAASEALLVKAYAARIRALVQAGLNEEAKDRKSTRLNSSHVAISYAVFCLKKKKKKKKKNTNIQQHKQRVA